jgi:hypothetical protein
MKSINFSKHSLEKIKILRESGIMVGKEMVKKTIYSPEKLEKGYKGRIVAQSKMDEKHVLRVIYKEVNEDEILVITLYPGRKERYE